jgi:hypothetical protein
MDISTRDVFRAWEKLRIPYNLALVGVSLLIWLSLESTLGFVGPLAVGFRGALIANLLFFAGPIVEAYIRWLRPGLSGMRWVLFFAGLLFAMLLAASMMVSFTRFGFGLDD